MINSKINSNPASSTQNLHLTECDTSTQDDANNEQILLNDHSTSDQSKIDIINKKQLQYTQSNINNYENRQNIKLKARYLKIKEFQDDSKEKQEKNIKFLKALFFILIMSFIMYLGLQYIPKNLFSENKQVESKQLNLEKSNLMTQQNKEISLKHDNQIKKENSQQNLHQQNQQNPDLINYNQLKAQNKLLKKLLMMELEKKQKQQKSLKQFKQQNVQINNIKQQLQQLNLNDILQENLINKLNQLKGIIKQLENKHSLNLQKPKQTNQNNKQIKQKSENIVQKVPNSYIQLSQLVNLFQKSQISAKPQFVSDPNKCFQNIAQKLSKYGQLYEMNIPFENFLLNSNVQFFVQSGVTHVNKMKYQEAVYLIDLIHRVDQKGNLNIEGNSCQDTLKMRSRLTNVMKSQFQRLNQEYQIDYYHSKQLRFCIVVNSYNNAHNGLIYRNIDSILQQNYTNYHVVYTDDKSPDRTGEIVKNYLEGKTTNTKFKIKINTEKVGMMQNIYQAITNDCQLGQIVVMLDGDDSLVGTNVLSFLNAVYQQQKIALMWSNFLSIYSDNRAAMGFSSDYYDYQKSTNSFRSQTGFISSHLKSFYVDLFRKIKVDDLKGNDGKFYGGASDLATMYPMIQMTNNHAIRKFKYVPEIMYEYRFDTGQSGMVTNRPAQVQAVSKISVTKPYQILGLDQYKFIDDAIQNALHV